MPLPNKTIKVLYKLSYFFWYLFIFTIPFGTRLIIKSRLVDGVFVEWGTISIFASETVLLFLCFFVSLLIIFDWGTVKNRILEYKKVIIALAVFLALALISAINSQFFAASSWQFLRVIEVSLLLVSVIILRPSFKNTALVFSLSLIPSLILGIFQFGFQFSPASKWLGIAQHLPEVLGTSVVGTFVDPAVGGVNRFLRVYGTFAHPNIFAAYLTVNFWVLIYLILKFSTCSNSNDDILRPTPISPGESRSSLLRWRSARTILAEWTKKSGRGILSPVLYFLFFLNFYCLFLTFSRAAWMALLVSLLVCWFISLLVKPRETPLRPSPFKKGGGLGWGILVLFLLLFIFASVLVCAHHDLVFSRFGKDSYLEVKSISERVAGLGEAKEIIFKSPRSSPFEKGGLRGILFGVGPGAYTYALAQKFFELSPYQLQPVHNVWLLILSELGIFGFLAFIIFLIQIIRNINFQNKIPHLPRLLSGSASGGNPPPLEKGEEGRGIFISPFTKGGIRGILIIVLLVLSLFDHYLWSLWPGLALAGLILSFGFLSHEIPHE